MGTKRKYKSEAFEAIHTSANALFDVGAIDKTTMRSFDDACLLEVPDIAAMSFPRRRESIYK